MEEEKKLEKVISVVCDGCGAKMVYNAKDQQMKCDNCGTTKPVPTANDLIVEVDFREGLALEAAPKGLGIEARAFHCKTCGAVSMVEAKTVNINCTFCDSQNVNEEAYNTQMIKPAGVIPFSITKDKAAEAFKTWIGSGWFRPGNLAKMARPEKFGGMYIPFWTYDAHTDSSWTAEAGYHYYETEHYTDSEGKSQTRQVQHTRWVPASGYFQHWFDDVLVIASKGVEQSRAQEVYPYDLKKVVNYEPSFLLGWKSELYAKDVKQGFEVADKIMDEHIRNQCFKQVPGDTQRNLNVRTKKYKITFKHILLPLWVSAYQFGGKTWQVIVNGQTGKISGGKPYSVIKITLAVIFAIIVIVGIYMLTKKH